LAAALADEITVLNDSRTLEEKQNELRLLEEEVKNQQLEQKQTASEHRSEHLRVAQVITKKINEDLVQPLRAVRDEIDSLLTEGYIRREVEAGRKNISLPPDAQMKLKQVTVAVSEEWVKQQKQVELSLNDLKAEYVAAIQKNNVQLNKALGGMKIELPEIKIDLKLDLSSVVDYQNKKRELEQSLEKTEAEMELYEIECAKLSANDPRLHSAQEAYKRAQQKLANLGSQPDPYTRQSREQVAEAGVYSDAKYETFTRYDDSNVKEYQAQRAEISHDVRSREQLLEKLIQADFERNEKRQTAEVLKRKAEQQWEKIEKQRKAQEQSIAKEQEAIVADTLHTLRNNTMGELNNRIHYLEKNASKIIEQLFDNQLTALLACVEEQFMQPLQAKQAKREEVLGLFKQGQQETEMRKVELINAKKQLDEVMAFTQTALVN
jgi:hypothetical protein